MMKDMIPNFTPYLNLSRKTDLLSIWYENKIRYIFCLIIEQIFHIRDLGKTKFDILSCLFKQIKMGLLPRNFELFRYLDPHTAGGLIDIMNEFLLPNYYTVTNFAGYFIVSDSEGNPVLELQNGGNHVIYRHPFVYVDINVKEHGECGSDTVVYVVVKGSFKIVKEKITNFTRQKEYKCYPSEDGETAIFEYDGRIVHTEPMYFQDHEHFHLTDDYMLIEDDRVALNLKTLEKQRLPGAIFTVPISGNKLILKDRGREFMYDLDTKQKMWTHVTSVS